MNLILVGILIFLLVYGFFWLLANTKSKTFSNFFRVSTIIGSILVIIVLFFAGRYLLSIPFFVLIAGALQKRLFNIFNIIYLYKIFFNKSAKGGGFFNDNSRTVRGSMSKDEALKILGLKPNCSKKDIIKAHRNLILHMHPDKKGGNNYLASKINEARDVLLKK